MYKARIGRHRHLEYWRTCNPSSTEPPAVLKDIEHAKQLETVQPCHVYFLLKEGEVVYVGQTGSAWPNRIENHVRDEGKDFDDVWYVEVDRESMDEVEAHYIAFFRPPLNTRGVPAEAP